MPYQIVQKVRYFLYISISEVPISGINDTEKAVKLKKYNETLKKVGTVLVDDDLIEEIIQKKLAIQKMSLTTFTKSIKSKE